MPEIACTNALAALTHVYTRASTSPARGRTRDGSEWVIKFKGAGPGPVGLLTEFVALRVARAMKLHVPAASPVYLPSAFPWMLGTDEFDGIVQRSFGWNLGVAFIEGGTPANPSEVVGGEPLFLERLAHVDRALTNTDRSVRNTNILASPAGLVAIDFDACLFLRRAIRGIAPETVELWPNHLLLSRECLLPLSIIPPEPLIAAIDEVPGEWIESTALDRAAMKSRLLTYTTAWNALALA